MKKIVSIHGIEYLFHNELREETATRNSFNGLATKTFGLSFENWYQAGYWKNAYCPYSLLHEGVVVANASVNHIHTSFEGIPRHYIQIGTVMTEKAYRGKGLAAFLMERILEDWAEKTDGIFLFANDSVLDFYPKFGFVKAEEYQCTLPFSGGLGMAVQLQMDKEQDVMLLLSTYEKGNPFSALPMVDNQGLLMFYCSQFMSENVYFCPKTGAVVVAEIEGKQLICSDIFGGLGHSLTEILTEVAPTEVTEIVFGFSPKDTAGMTVSLRQEDTTLFLLDKKENLFADHQLMFPLLSHA